MFDVLIKNGRVIDGSGNPWVEADVAIQGDVIAYVGKGGDLRGKLEVDALGCYVTPGFIDIHTHSDFTVLQCPEGHSKIRQGITTELAGHCGYSLVPVEPERLEGLKKFSSFMPGSLDWDWVSVEDLLNKIDKEGISMNFQTLIGQGTLRIAAMGFEQREGTPQELERMKALLSQALDQGAAGMSMGLVYSPGSFAPMEEIVELAKLIRDKDKILTAHVRDEGDQVEEALEELLEIGRRSGVKIQMCHLKAQGKLNWPKMDHLIQMIERAREQGVDVTFDAYAYTRLNTLLLALLPGWAQEGGVPSVVARLSDETQRERILAELPPIALKYGDWDNITIASVGDKANAWIEGRTLAEIALETKVPPAEAMLNALRDDQCGIMVVANCMDEQNVIKALKHPLGMLCSDGKILSQEGPLSLGRPHPRNYGAFPRFLAHYIRDMGIMPLEEAVKKMTSAPAQKMGLWDRGVLRPGLKADVAVFDFERFQDHGTFTDPHQYATGLKALFVNGALTIENDRHTGCRNGRVLR